MHRLSPLTLQFSLVLSVADAVLYSLLKVMYSGVGCSGIEGSNNNFVKETLPFKMDNTSVADDVDACFICISPVTQIDAKSDHANESSKVAMCDDWKWITDERNRSGWQSDHTGSLIRFRLKLSKKPYITITFMRSHSTFGHLRLSFRAVSSDDEQPLLGCDDKLDGQSLPFIDVPGDRESFSLWDSIVFPAEYEGDPNTNGTWKLFNETVLSKSNVEYVDVYVQNPNHNAARSRIKIQTVTSC